MKMNEQAQQLEALLPVPVAEDIAVLFVCIWGLLNAGAGAVFFATGYILSLFLNVCDLLPVELTCDEATKANASALMLGSFWCGVLQAVAGTLALLLAGRRHRARRALAYVVLAATVAGHGMFAGAGVIYLTPFVGYFFSILAASVSIYGYAMGDLDSFLVLMGKRSALE